MVTKTKSTTKKTTTKKLGALNAAVQVLHSAKEPMTCKAIMDVILEKGLWATKGRTPHATLYSAITREIKNKGKQARFTKVDRGRFKLAGIEKS